MYTKFSIGNSVHMKAIHSTTQYKYTQGPWKDGTLEYYFLVLSGLPWYRCVLGCAANLSQNQPAGISTLTKMLEIYEDNFCVYYYSILQNTKSQGPFTILKRSSNLAKAKFEGLTFGIWILIILMQTSLKHWTGFNCCTDIFLNI